VQHFPSRAAALRRQHRALFDAAAAAGNDGECAQSPPTARATAAADRDILGFVVLVQRVLKQLQRHHATGAAAEARVVFATFDRAFAARAAVVDPTLVVWPPPPPTVGAADDAPL